MRVAFALFLPPAHKYMYVCMFVPIPLLLITLVCGSLPLTTPRKRYCRRKLIVNCILDLFDVDNKHNKDVGDKFCVQRREQQKKVN